MRNESLLQKLVPVLDNFEMAQAAAQNAQGEGVKSLADGVAMIQTQLKAALAEAGLEDVDATGQTFDPNMHEAVLAAGIRRGARGEGAATIAARL